MRSLIERNGATAFVAPSMREMPLVENSIVFTFLEELQAGQIEVVIFMTGVGARAVLDVVTTKVSREAFFSDLWKCTVVVRGPKPVAVLREWGVRIDYRAPEPNTWRELLATLDAEVPLAGRSVALQEYGKPNLELIKSLRERGATVLPVPVYRWELPADTRPLRAAVDKLIAEEFDLLLVTSAQQVQHLLLVAEHLGLREKCLAAAKRCLIGSIGPTATETLEDVGLHADFEPSHPKMGTLVKEVLEAAPGLLAARSTSTS
jgi:uroporphyrinogen-III synthase